MLSAVRKRFFFVFFEGEDTFLSLVYVPGTFSLVLTPLSLLLHLSELGQEVLVLPLELLHAPEGHSPCAGNLRAAAHGGVNVLPHHLGPPRLLQLHQQDPHLTGREESPAEGENAVTPL